MNGGTSRPGWLLAASMALLGACGGGKHDDFTIDTGVVAFSADVADTSAPAPQIVNGSIVNVDTSVYLFISMTDHAVANVALEQTGATTARLIVYPKAPRALGVGFFQDTITVKACTDSAGHNQIAGSPKTVVVTYRVSGLAASPSSVSLGSIEGAASEPVQVAVRNGTGSDAWTTSIAYGAGADGWLTLSPSSGSSAQPLVALTGGTLAPGTYAATATIAAGGHSLQLPVTYTVAAKLSVSQASVAFDAIYGQATLPAGHELAASTPQGAATFSTSVSYGPGASGWLDVAGASAPGTLTLRPGTVTLPPDVTYLATVTLTPDGGGTPVSVEVSYRLVTSTLTLAAAPTFVVDLGSAPTDAFLRRPVGTGDTGVAVAWTATSPVPWLTVTPGGTSGDRAILTLVPGALDASANGTQHALIDFAYLAPGAAASAHRTLDVALTIDLPTIHFVTPNVAYLGEQLPVTIRGARLGTGPVPAVSFGGRSAASVVVKSDTELLVVPPAIDVAGRQAVSVGSGLGMVRTGADLVVRAHPAYAYAAIPFGVGFQDRHVIYDAERDAVFSYCSWFGDYSAKAPSTINRYAYDPVAATWTHTSTFVPQLWDIGLSPDGKYLLALGTSRLWLLDPVTLAALDHVDITGTGMGTAGQVGVVNDGKVLLRDLGLAWSLVTRTFTTVRFPGSIGITVSADGGRAVVGDANSAQYVPLSIYDAGTGQVTASQAFEYFQVPSLDRTGSRYFSGGNLRDATLALIGGIPTGMGYMRPDGRRAYQVSGTQRSRILGYDLSGNGPSFPQLADIVLPDTVDGYWLHASLDSRFLFIPGPDKFMVVPLP